MPFALIAAALFAMALHIIGTTIHHRLAWEPTVATVISSEPVQVLRTNGTSTTDLQVAVAYDAGGSRHEWSGRGSDIGVYAASVGDSIQMLFDPADPSHLDTAAMKGWKGGLLVLAVTGGFVAFYVWFFWLRRRGGNPPSRGIVPPPAPARTAAPPRPSQSQRASFGNR